MACRWIRLLFVMLLAALPCRAAVTVEDAYAWAGHKNMEMFIGNAPPHVVLSTSVSVPPGAGDDVALAIGGTTGGTAGWTTWPIAPPSSSTEYVHVAGWIRINNPDLVIDTSVDILTIGPDQGLSRDIAVRITSAGTGSDHTVHLVNAAGTIISSNDDVFADDDWYWLEVFYQPKAGGVARLIVSTPTGGRGAVLSIVEVADFDDGSAGDYGVILHAQHHASVPFGGQSTFYWANLVIEYGITTAPDDGLFKMASMMSVPYKSGVTSDAGDNLDGGDWDDVGDGVIATRGEFNATNGGGIDVDDDTSHGVAGPAGQFGTGVTPLAGKWTVYARNTGVSGKGQVFYGKYDGTSRTTATSGDMTGCAGLCNMTVFQATGGSQLPDLDEWFVAGGHNSNLISGALWMREVRTFYFTTYPFDEEAVVSLIDRVPFRATWRAERIGG